MKQCGNCKHWKHYGISTNTGSCEAPIPIYITMRNRTLHPQLDKEFIGDDEYMADTCPSYEESA